MNFLKHLFRKKQKPETQKTVPSLGDVTVYLEGKPVVIMHNPYPYPVEIQSVTTKGGEVTFTFTGLFTEDIAYLEAQLQSALESENYEEAARIRDLINRK